MIIEVTPHKKCNYGIPSVCVISAKETTGKLKPNSIFLEEIIDKIR